MFEGDDAEVCNLFKKRKFGLSNDDMQEVRRNSIDAERVNKILGEMPNRENNRKWYENMTPRNVY